VFIEFCAACVWRNENGNNIKTPQGSKVDNPQGEETQSPHRRATAVCLDMGMGESAHRGKWGQLTPWKNGWKIKKRKHAKRAVFWMGVGVKWYEWWLVCQADDYYYCYCSDILPNAPFCSQIFNIFFASGGKGALTPLTKILRIPLTKVVLIGNTEVIT